VSKEIGTQLTPDLTHPDHTNGPRAGRSAFDELDQLGRDKPLDETSSE
jgi:hypothetical protein